MAPVLLFAYGAATEGLSGRTEVSETLIFTTLFGSVAALYALPVAGPVIIFTELRKRGSWAVFALAGIVLGTIMTVLFTEVPFTWSNLSYSAVILPIVVACVLTYWAIAWKWLGPDPMPQADL
jgi:uncharacterized protein YacL